MITPLSNLMEMWLMRDHPQSGKMTDECRSFLGWRAWRKTEGEEGGEWKAYMCGYSENVKKQWQPQNFGSLSFKVKKKSSRRPAPPPLTLPCTNVEKRPTGLHCVALLISCHTVGFQLFFFNESPFMCKRQNNPENIMIYLMFSPQFIKVF